MSTEPLNPSIKRRTLLKAGFTLGALQFASPLVVNAAAAEKKYGPGATDSQIKIGNIMPYSGPASAYAVIGKTEAAFFQMINDEGGINGRKVSFISYDDGYSPPKTFEQARKLVEDDDVLLIFNSLGTPTNTAIHVYMNEKKVPQLFVATGATKWNDPRHFPWTMGWQPSYQTESRIYAKYILKEMPNAKIAILYQNDDYGKDYVKGLKDGLGTKAASMIVGEQSYETTEPLIDSEVVRLRSTGADVFFNVTTPKFAAQAIKKVSDIGWKPLHILNNVSASIGSVLKPAGFEHAQGIVSAAYLKDATDSQWKNDADMKTWNAFMDKYVPDGDKNDFEPHLRVQRDTYHGPGSETVRRRSHPGKRHEAGRQFEELSAGTAVAGNSDQYQPDGLRSARSIAINEVRRSDVAAVRGCDERTG